MDTNDMNMLLREFQNLTEMIIVGFKVIARYMDEGYDVEKELMAALDEETVRQSKVPEIWDPGGYDD